MSDYIGITTTVPVEAVFAAGKVPVDLNNLFISSRVPPRYVNDAELNGLPRNTCAWTKGIFEIAKARGITRVLGVVEGDCANSRAIMERWQYEGMDVIPFSFPYDRNRARLRGEIGRLAKRLGVSWKSVEAMKKRLDALRKKVHQIDELTWRDGVVTGEENHFWNISCSDFWGDPQRFEKAVDGFIAKVRKRKTPERGIAIGYVGVPPIVQGLYDYLREIGFRVCFNEVQRQFSMPFDTADIVEQYLCYTYPYDISARLEDIKGETERRGLKALIHYVQSFCHRGIEDRMVRREVGVPVLTFEFDRPGKLDERSKIRLEAFWEMLAG
jgi:benzoyl-CoA reductase/2-hydroxyglutaryl-CoA dehydratase subunit BcrC/BadD/HgdB